MNKHSIVDSTILVNTLAEGFQRLMIRLCVQQKRIPKLILSAFPQSTQLFPSGSSHLGAIITQHYHR